MKNKNVLLVIIVIVILLAIGYVFSRQSNNVTDQNNNPQTSHNTDRSENATTTPHTKTTQSPQATAKKLNYGEAVNTYKYRFQFSQCHGTPGTISVKKGAPVMLDNRDAVAHTIKANGQSFKIAGYNYALIYPTQATQNNIDLSLSNVTCDGGGAATLNVEN